MRSFSQHSFAAWVACVLATALASGSSEAYAQPWSGPMMSPTESFQARGQVSAYVRRVFQDRDGHLWLGTNDDGVGRFDGRELMFYGPREGLAGRAVRGIAQDQGGAVWIATDSGVSRFEHGVFTTFRLGEAARDNDAWSLFLDRSGAIWVSTLAGVSRFDGKAFVPFELPAAKAPIGRSLVGPGVVLDMAQDQSGSIWFATDGAGLFKYDGAAFASYTSVDGLGSDQVLCVHADRRGRIWMGTDGGGVTCIDGGKLRTYSAKDGLGIDRVWDVTEDRRGDLWFATLGAGVTRFDGARLTVFGAADGLSVSHVQHLFEDRNGTLWLGCSGGLFRREGERFVNVMRDGPWSAEPLAAFSRLIGGRWKMTTAAGRDTYDTWHWGPGKQSIRSMRLGSLTDGSPWSAMTAYYWHPGFGEIRLLSVGSVMRGVGEGRTTFEGDRAESVFTLHQIGGPRSLRDSWTFVGPDRYRDDLSEMAGNDYELLAGWDRLRVAEAERADGAGVPFVTRGGTPSELMRPLERVLGRAWESAAGDGPDAARAEVESRTRSTFQYVPHTDAIYARVEVINDGSSSSHAMDIYLYHHTGTRSLRCLALASFGSENAIVFEGDIVPAGDGGSFKVHLTEHRSSGQWPLEGSVEFMEDGLARVQVWRPHAQDRTLVLDRWYGRASK